MKLLWHYTTNCRFKLIDAEGFLRPAAPKTSKERPAVWFSSDLFYEPTAAAKEARNMCEMINAGFTLVRIGVSPNRARLVYWTKFKRVSGISDFMARVLEFGGRKMGANPKNWWACFDPVPRECWAGVEAWSVDAARWLPLHSQEDRRA
jgi:hypothetical protein